MADGKRSPDFGSAWWWVFAVIFVLAGVVFTRLMWGTPAACAFVMGCLIGALWGIFFWARSLLPPEKPAWSGKIVGVGPPAAEVFNDDVTTEKLMLAFCDPGAVTPRLDRDTSEPELLHAWQRRAVKITIERIWEGE